MVTVLKETNMKITKNVVRAALAAILGAALVQAAPAQAQSADLAAAFTSSPSSVNFGQTAAYSIRITNLGPDTATDLTMTAVIPAGTQVTSVAGCTPVDPAVPVVNWFPCTIRATLLPYLPAAAIPQTVRPVVTVSLKYLFPDPLPTTCPATTYFSPVSFTVASATTDPVTANNVVTKSPTVKPLADIAVTVTGPAEVSHGGGTYVFNYSVQNNGPCTAPYVELAVDDSVATGFKWAAATGICGAKDAEYYACSLDNNAMCWADADCVSSTGASLGTCVERQIDGDFLPDGTDYQYCAAGTMVPGDPPLTGTKTYTLAKLPAELTSSNQGTGLKVVTYTSIGDPDLGNNVSDVTYVVTKSSGCSSTGSGTAFGLIVIGLAALFLKRRRTA
jgi:uncharacterized repeat protein (TIGR01451 family)/MYXO-CTERM domain-containing protein